MVQNFSISSKPTSKYGPPSRLAFKSLCCKAVNTGFTYLFVYLPPQQQGNRLCVWSKRLHANVSLQSVAQGECLAALAGGLLFPEQARV